MKERGAQGILDPRVEKSEWGLESCCELDEWEMQNKQSEIQEDDSKD